jgi:hypothetical protein
MLVKCFIFCQIIMSILCYNDFILYIYLQIIAIVAVINPNLLRHKHQQRQGIIPTTSIIKVSLQLLFLIVLLDLHDLLLNTNNNKLTQKCIKILLDSPTTIILL